MSVNKVILLGFVGKDPEIRSTKTGITIANFSLATSESWKVRETGEVKQNTQWHNISVIGNLAKIVENYVKKGSKLYIEGKIQTEEYTNKEGKKCYATKVVLQGYNAVLELLDKKEEGQIDKHNEAKGNGYQPQKTEEFFEPLPNDEIPF